MLMPEHKAPTIAELETIQQELLSLGDRAMEIVQYLVTSEIRRRRNAGRKKSSPYDRRKQNQLAQQRFRNKNVLMSAREQDKKNALKCRNKNTN